jgi:PAS domain S-box-containing protein
MQKGTKRPRLLAEDIFDTVRETLIILDENMHVVSANRSFYENFRVKPEQTEGLLIFDLGNGQWNIPELRHLLENIIPQQSTFNDFRVQHTFETIGSKVMQLNGRRIIREKGESALILLAIEDITDIDLTQRKLEQSETKYRKFVEGLNSIIIGFNPEGEIMFFNHFSEKIFGYNRTEVIGKPFVGTIIPCVESTGKNNAHICTEIFQNPQKYYVNESEGIRKDGSRIIFSWSAKASYDETGNIKEIMIDGTDLTEVASARKKNEQSRNQLAKQRLLYENVVTNARVAIAVFKGYDLVFTYANPTYKAVRPDIEMIGKMYHDVFPEAAQLGAEEKMLQVLKTGIPWIIQKYSAPVPGKPDAVWEGQIVRIEPQPDETEPSLLSVVWDVTDNVHMENALKKSEGRFRRVYESNMLAIAFWKAGGTLTEANTAFCNLIGCTPEEVSSGTIRWVDFTPPDILWRDQQGIDEIAKTGVCAPYEKTFIHRDGRVVPVLIGAASIAGIRDQGVAYCVDLSQQKKNEQQLKSERELLQTIIDTIPVMITLYDPQIRKVEYNKAFEMITGWTERDASQKPLMELVYPDQDQRKVVAEYMRSLTPGFRDLVMTGKNGDPIETSWANVRIPDGRQVGIGIDMRDRKHYEENLRKRTEELSAANRDLESFSYSVAHDLRNPLKIIKGFIEILMEDCSQNFNDECIDYLKRINTGAIRMSSIIDDILALSKISRQEMVTEEIDLTELARSVINELRKGEPERKVDVTINNGIKACADKRLMSVVLNNLIGNAWKYTSKTTNPKNEFGILKNEVIIYYVNDNGAGFDMKLADQLFAPFKRLHSDKDFSGTGVGLAIVERATSRHDGKIWAEGEPGKGATFFFTLST